MKSVEYTIRGVSQTYNGRRVLHIREMEIYEGEILVLVGPSGAGKSTLLRLLNFLEAPTEGEILYRGERFSRQNEMPLHLRRQVTTVFQRSLLLNRSVLDNTAYGMAIRGQKEPRLKSLNVLEKLGLGSLAGQAAHTLSGGEAQRVALARAIALKPRVLLLDEPTANLDPYHIEAIEDTILRLNLEENTTAVMVTHNVFQARRMAHRIAFLLNGEVVEIAENQTFFDTPVDNRTRAFVHGDMVY